MLSASQKALLKPIWKRSMMDALGEGGFPTWLRVALRSVSCSANAKRPRPLSSLLLFQEVDDEVADLLEPLHHHQMPSSFDDHQPPVLDSLCNTAASDALGAGIYG